MRSFLLDEANASTANVDAHTGGAFVLNQCAIVAIVAVVGGERVLSDSDCVYTAEA